jgi:hypothetical protein
MIQHFPHVFLRPVMRIFVAPLETPAACHVGMVGATLKLFCEDFAEYRTRLSLPYDLRNIHLLAKTGQSTLNAKAALSRAMPMWYLPSARVI